MRRVILLLSDSGMARRLLPTFGRAGLSVIALAPRRDPIRHSRFLDEFVEVPDDPVARTAMFAQKGMRAGPGDWFVPGSDDVLWSILDGDLPIDLQIRLLPVGGEEGLAALDSKGAMARARAQSGVRQPAFATTLDDADVRRLAAELGYPVVVKQNRGRAGGGVQVLQTSNDRLVLGGAGSSRGLLVEQFVEGTDVSVEALFLEGRLAVLVTSRVIASLGTHGVSVAREFVDCADERLVRDLQSLGRNLGLDGFANVSCRKDTMDRHWVFEVDMRPNVWHAYLPGVAVDLAAALVSTDEEAVRGLRLEQSPVVVRNLSRSLLHITSPQGVRDVPSLLRRETVTHVHTGDWGMLPGEVMQVSRRWLRHVRQGIAARRS